MQRDRVSILRNCSEALTLALFAGSMGAAAPAAMAQRGERVSLDEIIVTAQRRQESLQQTPLSVSALSSETLEQRQVFDTLDIVFNAPNLTGNANIGQSTATTFFIRGVGTTENLATADTSVGLYVDDVYIARQAVNNFQLFDIERVEVLRGPQGTLYGRNTNGGAIKVVTKKPNDETEIEGRFTYGSFDRYEAKISGNAPLTDTLFVRGGVLVEQADGWKENITLDRDVDDTDYVGTRFALRALPSDRVTIDIAFDWSRDRTNGGYASDIAGVLRPSTGDLRTVVSGTDARGFARTWGLSANVAWDINDNYTLTSISGYRQTFQDLFLDLSDQPVSLFELEQTQDAEQFSQEFQLNGQILPNLQLTSGLYYFHEQVDADLTNFIGANFFANTFDTTVDSYAVFAHLDYSVGPFTLIAGGRYTRDEKSLNTVATSSIPAPAFNFDTNDLRALREAGQAIDPDLEFDKFTPKVGLNWQINDDLFAFASWTRGFRSGGWTGRAVNSSQYLTFDPENVESYEVGLKATLFDGRMTLNSAGFFMEYTDLFNTLTIDGVFTVQTADAEIYGFESEAALQATSWLSFFANIGVLETSYTGDAPDNLADELQRAPNFQGKIGFAANYPLPSGNVLAGVDLFYTSDYLTNPANLAVTAPSVDSGVSRTDDYSLLNARLGYQFGDDDRYSVIGSCTNCLDEEYFNAITVIGSYAAAYAGPPRIFRITAEAQF